MARYVVRTGDVFLLADDCATMAYTGATEDPTIPPGEAVGDAVPLPPRDTYGQDWIVVDAADEADALAQAEAFAARRHPAQTEMEMFEGAYRAGAFDLCS